MLGIINVILPVFGLLGLGYFGGTFRFLGPQVGEGLSAFVFIYCLPALIFRTIATAVFPEAQPWGYWLSYFIAVALCWAAAMFIASRTFRANRAESVVFGFAAGQSNTVFVGIPLILKAYGDAAVVPLFLLLAIHLPVTMTSATLMMEGRERLSFASLFSPLLRNPVLQGLIAGLLWRLTGFEYGGPLKTIVDYVADASIPCALIATGLALHRYGIRGEFKLVSVIASLKLLAHPALVWLFAFKIFSMPPVWSGVAVLFAAMPTGVNSYLFAERYKAGVPVVSSTIALSTGLSFFSTMFWLWALHIGQG
jgi:predicted permease